MPRSRTDLIPIIINPERWPTHTLERARSRKAPPEFWAALKSWGSGVPHVGYGEEWYKEFDLYHLALRGWRLVGRGEMPTSVLGPDENKYTRGRRLATNIELVDTAADWLAGHPEWKK
jgi:hypothetical protein